MSLHIAILTGGVSAEREVAKTSARSVAEAVKDRADVVVFDIPGDLEDFLSWRKEFNCVIPVFHGRGGEDGTIQGFLETLGIPYIFSGVGAHVLAIDKAKTNAVVGSAGVNVPKSVTMASSEGYKWTHNVVIKPIDGGSSVGISIAHNQAEFDRGIREASAFSSKVLVEDYIAGREYSVAVVEVDGKTEALPVISIESKHEYFDYQSKYEPGLAEEKCPADISPELSERLKQTALVVHHAIGARHVTRSDFIVDRTEKIWFLETNTIPGMTVLLPMPVRASGRDFGEVVMGWVKDATLTK